MGVLNNAVLLGPETNYGVVSTDWRGTRAEGNGWEAELKRIDPEGSRPGAQAQESNFTTFVPFGGGGKIEQPWLTKGMTYLIPALLGPVTGPTLVAGSTGAYDVGFSTDVDGPVNESFSAQIHKSDAAGVMNVWQHRGAVMTSWELKHTGDGQLIFMADFMSSVVDGPPQTAAVYTAVDGASPFHFGMVGHKVNDGSFECVKDFTLKADLGYSAPETCQRQSTNLVQPIRENKPKFTLDFELHYLDNDLYNIFKNGQTFKFSSHWQGPEIETGVNHELELTMAACMIPAGAEPESAEGARPTQKISAEVMYNDVDDVIVGRYRTTDSTL